MLVGGGAGVGGKFRDGQGAAGNRPLESSLLLKAIFFFINDPATTVIYTLSLHDALPI